MENVSTVVPTSNGGFALDYNNVLWHWHGEVTIWNEDRVIPARLSPEPVLENVATISNNGSFAITTDGRAYTLGWLEPAIAINGVRYATSLGGANFAITTDNHLVAWGRNRLPDHWRSAPLLGDGTTIYRDTPVLIMENVASITLKGNTAYAITTTGELWGWGNNGGALGSGLIGDGSIFVWDDIEEDMWDFYVHEDGFEDGVIWLMEDDAGTGVRLSPVKIMENIVVVAPTYFIFDHGWIRGFRTFALTTTGEIWAWGQNDTFWDDVCFVGDGTGEDRLYPVKITG